MSRQRHGPGAGHVSGPYPRMPASQDVGVATPEARPYAVVRRTRRRGGTVRGAAVPDGCVLRQRGDQLVAGLEPFLLVDDVVAVADGAARVAGQAHGDPLGHAGADQMAGGGGSRRPASPGREVSRGTCTCAANADCDTRRARREVVISLRGAGAPSAWPRRTS